MERIEAEKGESIWLFAIRATKEARRNGREIEGVFNDVALYIYPSSTDREIYYQYEWKMELRKSK